MQRIFFPGAFLVLCAFLSAQGTYDELLTRARSSLTAKDYPAAVTAAQQAMGVDNRRWEAYAIAANGYSGQRLYDDAIESLQSALARAPDIKKPLIREALSDLRKEQGAPPPVPSVQTPASPPTVTYRIADVRISSEGKRVMFGGESADSKQIYTVSLDGGIPRRITSEGNVNERGRWSSDSKSIVFLSNRGGSSQIWTMNTDGSNAHKLTADPPRIHELAVSAKIVYLALDHLFKLSYRGVGEPQGGLALTPDRSVAGEYDIAPDGAEVCYVSATDSAANFNLYTVPMAGGASRRITTSPAADRNPIYSPDGRYIAYRAQLPVADDRDRWRLVVLERITGKVTNLTEELKRSVKTFAWSPDSGQLFFVVDESHGSNLLRVPVTGGTFQVTVSYADQHISEMQFTPDGKTLLFLAQKGQDFPKLYRALSSGGVPSVLAP
jgi:Tol biopolymer transport system component